MTFRQALKKLIQYGNSFFTGISTGSAIGYSVARLFGNTSVGVAAGAVGCIADGTASHFFQGSAIVKEHEEVISSTMSQAYREALLNEDEVKPSSCTTKIIHGLYGGFSSAKVLADRYFLLSVLLDLFAVELSLPLFCTTLASDVLIKLMFDATNENWEVGNAIAEKIDGHEALPYYAPLLKPLSGYTARTVLSAVGSLEHTSAEDLLPLLGFLTPAALQALVTEYKDITIPVASSVGPLLAACVFFQTFLFEGHHTRKNLRDLNFGDDPKLGPCVEPDRPLRKLPSALVKVLDKSFLLMGVLHGAGSALPNYIFCSQVLGDSEVNLPISLVVTALTFLSITIGTQLSEVSEARRGISQELADRNAALRGLARR